MVDYKEILRLSQQYYSLRQIAASVCHSHHTVKNVLDLAAQPREHRFQAEMRTDIEGGAMYGYKIINGRAEIDEAEAAVIIDCRFKQLQSIRLTCGLAGIGCGTAVAAVLRGSVFHRLFLSV